MKKRLRRLRRERLVKWDVNVIIRPKHLCAGCAFGTAIEGFATLADCSIFGELQPSPSHCCFYDGPSYPVDVIIITAVIREFDAVLKHLHPDGEQAWVRHTTISDGSWYISTFLGKAGSRLRLAVAKQSTMGLSAAASLAAQAIQIFRPAVVMMCGITAGYIEETKVGDIISAKMIFDYGCGRWAEKDGKLVFHPLPEPHQVDDEVIDRYFVIKRDKDFLRGIHAHWQDHLGEQKTFATPDVHVGTLVSGAAVIDAKAIWDRIIGDNIKVIALDMEAYGIAQATKSARNGNYKPQLVVAKSVCDFGMQKQDGAQDYAAFTSARFLRRYIELYIEWCVDKNPIHFNVNKAE